MSNETPFYFLSSPRGPVGPLSWLDAWSRRYPTRKYSEDVYTYLLDKGPNLVCHDFDLLGAWKDGALSSRAPGHLDAGGRFDGAPDAFNRKWSPDAAGCAFDVWMRIPHMLSTLKERLRDEHSFLELLLPLQYGIPTAGKKRSTFGLSRATYVLHVFTNSAFPIYDKNTHSGLYRLLCGAHGGRRFPKTKRSDPDWYLNTFCPLVRDLEEACNATHDPHRRRAVDKALFVYGLKASRL